MGATNSTEWKTVKDVPSLGNGEHFDIITPEVRTPPPHTHKCNGTVSGRKELARYMKCTGNAIRLLVYKTHVTSHTGIQTRHTSHTEWSINYEAGGR